MNTKPVSVSTLAGPALDWVVAKCEGVKLTYASLAYQMKQYGCLQRRHGGDWRPSSDWSIAGPIIERENLSIMPAAGEGWRAYKTHRIDWVSQCYANGPTP